MLIVICLFLNYNTKVQRKIETTKYFMLIKFKENVNKC